MVYAPNGSPLYAHPVEIIVEGYAGRPDRLRSICELPAMDVSPKVYAYWLKLGKQQNILTHQ